MDAGRLDRRLRILERSDITESTYGTKTASWPELATVWAKVDEVLPSRADRLEDQLVVNVVRQAKIRIRWRDDVSQANRVELDGRQMRIISGPAMIGRRQWLDFMAEELSTEGQQP